ncbi:MAG: ThiF family adenylyltransferase [Verrucomicrobiota bacterium]
MSDFDFRFGGLARLYGADGLQRLRRAHALVVGVGGVGSWAVEALARSAVGLLTMVDLDEVCVSNVNRQLPALDGTLGLPKVEVLAARIRAIHPQGEVRPRMEFFTAETAGSLLEPPGERRPDVVIDAIDHVGNKTLLIARCVALGIPVVVCGGAGGRRDPTALRVVDLAAATHDRLLVQVRKRLRQDHGFSRDATRWGVDCLASTEPPVFPRRDGTVCAARDPEAGGESLRLNCDAGFGSACFVTGAMGFAAAAVAIRHLTGTPTRATRQPPPAQRPADAGHAPSANGRADSRAGSSST